MTDETFNLKERYKPIWYALMHYQKDKYPHEFKRMGAELEEMRSKYAN